MIDVHSHCLPGIDDGAADSASACQMLQTYCSQEVTDIICTPHIEPQHLVSRAELELRLEQVEQKITEMRLLCSEQALAITLHQGCELILCPDLAFRLHEPDHNLGLAGTSYLLVELPRWLSGGLSTLDHLLFSIQMSGYMPVLAHPERVMGQPAVLDTLALWVEQGRLLLQVNTSSLVADDANWTADQKKRYRRRSAYVRQLLDLDLVHLAASDAHNPFSRAPLNQSAHQAVAAEYGQDLAWLLLEENPRLLLSDQPLRRSGRGRAEMARQ